MCLAISLSVLFFFFYVTVTTEFYTLSLHDALPISDEVSIAAEPRLPQMMADNGHNRRIRAVVILADHSPEHRCDTKQWKEIRRDRQHPQSRRFTGASQGHRASAHPCRDAFERSVVALPIEPVRWRDRVVAVALPRFVHHRQVIALGIRKRSQQQLINHGENGGIGADAERKREDDGDREAWTSAKAAAHVSCIAQNVFEEPARANLVTSLFLLEHAAEPPPCF